MPGFGSLMLSSLGNEPMPATDFTRPALNQGALAAAEVRKPNNTKRIIGILGDAISGAMGGPTLYHDALMRQHDEDQIAQRSMLAHQLQLAQWQAQQDYERQHPKPITIGNTIGTISPDGNGFTPIYTAPEREPAPVQIARAAGLTPGTPEWKASLTAALPGYGYTQPAIDAKTQAAQGLAAFRAAQSASLKAQPTYAQAHPKASSGRGGGKPAKLPTGFILD